MLTGPEAGITRDSIELDFRFKGQLYRLVDTAGMRRRARVADKVEKLMVDDALRAIQFAHLCVLLIDANEPIHKQDLAIARLIEDEGRAIVIGANKWDVVRDKQAASTGVSDRLQTVSDRFRSFSNRFQTISDRSQIIFRSFRIVFGLFPDTLRPLITK